MSSYEFSQTPKFTKALRILDRPVQREIMAALRALTVLEDPTAKLKPLRKTKAGLWRLRVGDYRVIVDVRRSELVVVALDTGHRSTIYDD